MIEAKTVQVYQVFIKATPDQIWDAITKPEFTQQYFYGSVIDSSFEPGTPYHGWAADRSAQYVDGEIVEADPPRRLRHTWRTLWDEDAAAFLVSGLVFDVARPRKLVHTWHAMYDPGLAEEDASRVTWEIEPQDGGIVKLTVVHDQLEASPKTA